MIFVIQFSEVRFLYEKFHENHKTLKKFYEVFKNKKIDTIHELINKNSENSDKKFDLVVGRPPVVQLKKYSLDAGVETPDKIRCYLDPGFKIHQEFFANIGKYLADDGVILLQKSVEKSDASDFEQFINDAGLKITQIFREKSYPFLYYMEIKWQ